MHDVESVAHHPLAKTLSQTITVEISRGCRKTLSSVLLAKDSVCKLLNFYSTNTSKFAAITAKFAAITALVSFFNSHRRLHSQYRL